MKHIGWVASGGPVHLIVQPIPLLDMSLELLRSGSRKELNLRSVPISTNRVWLFFVETKHVTQIPHYELIFREFLPTLSHCFH